MTAILAGNLLRQNATATRLAVVGADGALDYAALDAAADAVARAIRGAGLSKGERVAVRSRNCVDYAALFFGSARAGTVLVNLSVRGGKAETAHILAATQARLLFHDGVAPEAAVRTIAFGDQFAAFQAETNAVLDDLALSPDDPYCMTYTGGTTGRPRGVLVSHRARAGQARAIAAAFSITAEDVVCVATPMAHVAGLLVCFQPAVAAGATCALLERWDAGLFMACAEEHGVTAAMMVPTQLIDLLAHDEFDPGRLAGLRRVVHAGAPMPAALLDTLTRRLPGIEFIENYGQSELGALTVRRGADLPGKAGSIGRAIDGVELAVLGPDGAPAAPGETGELCCRGPNALIGYDGAHKETEALYKYGGGWIATGDAATSDEDGFYTLVERLRDIIIRGGENIYSVEVEAALFAHGDVADCAVFAVPDPRLGEAVAAHVVRVAGAKADEQALIEHCAARLTRRKAPRTIRFVSELPRTAVGKVRKNLLRDEYR